MRQRREHAPERTGGNATSVARGRLSDDGSRVENVQVIFRALPAYDGDKHFGSSLAFAPDGKLFITLGERSDAPMRPQAQDLASHMGKTIRINADGTVPQDNPFVGRAGALPEIWSLGHRNVQGVAVQPGTGAIWTIEHGTRGGDEVNLDKAGANYGWPEAASGVEYAGGQINSGATLVGEAGQALERIVGRVGDVTRLIETRAIPDFQPGDTLRVNVKIKEGERERVQAFEGVCIARSGGGVNETFTVRKISFGEGVERKFPILSPNIDAIEVKRRGVVRRAKLYYLRDRRGKSARIAEKQTIRPVKGVVVPETGTAQKADETEA